MVLFYTLGVEQELVVQFFSCPTFSFWGMNFASASDNLWFIVMQGEACYSPGLISDVYMLFVGSPGGGWSLSFFLLLSQGGAG